MCIYGTVTITMTNNNNISTNSTTLLILLMVILTLKAFELFCSVNARVNCFFK